MYVHINFHNNNKIFVRWEKSRRWRVNRSFTKSWKWKLYGSKRAMNVYACVCLFLNTRFYDMQVYLLTFAWKNKNKYYIQNLFSFFDPRVVALSKIISFIFTIISVWVWVEQERRVIFSSIFLRENLCQIISIKKVVFCRLSFIFVNKNKYKNNNTFFEVSDNEDHMWKITRCSYIMSGRNRS